MRHRRAGSKLGRNPSHRRATLRNLVTNVIEHERITTTLARARAARPLVEQMITLAKRETNTLHARRQAAAFLQTPGATQKLFETLGPRFSGRNGGYTRIVRAGFRLNDGAQKAVLELIGSELKIKEKKGTKAEKPQPLPEAKASP